MKYRIKNNRVNQGNSQIIIWKDQQNRQTFS